MQLIDISSLLHANQSFDDIIKASYMIQETRRTTDALFFVDTTKIDKNTINDVVSNLSQRGITPFLSEKALYHYLDHIQSTNEGDIELVSQDYLAISRAKDNTFIWDTTSMKRYSTKEFSESLLSFPHSRLGLFSLLTQDPYHSINTGVEFSPSSAISLVQTNETLKDLIVKESIPNNLKPKVVELGNAAKGVGAQLKMLPESLNVKDYFSYISLSKSEMRSLKGKSVDIADEGKNFTLLNTPLRITSLVNKIIENEEKKVVILIKNDSVGIRVRNKNYISAANEDMSVDLMFNTLAPFLENEAIDKITISAKEAHGLTFSKGINMNGLRADIELAEFTLNNLSKLKTLDDLMEHYFFEKALRLKGYEDTAHKMEQVERLHNKLIPMLENDMSLQYFQRVEMPLSKVLARIEGNGVYVNSGKLYQLAQYIDELYKKEENAIRQFTPQPLNINAPKEISKLLFDTLKLPSKSRSTSEENLLKIERETGHPVIQHIIKARQYTRLNNTFALKLPQKINPDTNRIHGTYNQNKVKTGRLSCENPSLQNIPSKNKLGRAIRKTFEAERNRKIVAADYSQVELKILAHLSNEPSLIEAFKTGRDIHQSTAALVFNKGYDEVTGDERKSAKAINFGLIYGMSKYGLASELNVTQNKASDFINAYFAAMPAVANFIQGLKDYAEENGYVKTITGRKINIENAQSSDYKSKASALRAASNAPMQGSASDIIKIAMIKVDHELRARQLDAKINMQVHDELIIDCDESQAMEVARVLKHCMENAVKLSVPLDVDVGIGENWENAHPVEIKNTHDDLEPQMT